MLKCSCSDLGLCSFCFTEKTINAGVVVSIIPSQVIHKGATFGGPIYYSSEDFLWGAGNEDSEV